MIITRETVGMIIMITGGLIFGAGFFYWLTHRRRAGRGARVRCSRCHEFMQYLPVNSHSRRRKMGLCESCFEDFLATEGLKPTGGAK